MKKYLNMTIALVAIITMGSASAIVFETSSLSIEKSLLLRETLDGGCGGHGCHNNSNMTEITGVLVVHNSTNFKIGTTRLNFGCYNYINTTISPYDFDGDGTIETIFNELLGLVGTSVTVKGYLRCQNTRLTVFYINGLPYREPCYSRRQP